MILSITGSSGFVGTNFIKEYPGYTIQDFYHTYKYQPEGVDVSGSSTLHLASPLLHQIKGAQKQEYF